MLSLVRLSPTLWTIFFFQVACTLFFAADVVGDMTGRTWVMNIGESDTLEYLVTVALGISVVFTGRHLLALLTRQKRLEQQMQVASGAFLQLLNAYFDDWALTPSERDVALMAIKGCTIAEMARLRATKDGTIKAQCNAVYRKAGVSSRTQLLSIFIEELMADGLPPRKIAP